jgi:hypothetical protein
LFLALAGCTDVSAFHGTWSGAAESSPLVLTGMAPGSTATLDLASVTKDGIAGTVTLTQPAPLRPLLQAMADQLGGASLPDSPLRCYWNAVTLDDGDALALVSLYNNGDSRVDLRLIRSDTLYVVFHLKRN